MKKEILVYSMGKYQVTIRLIDGQQNFMVQIIVPGSAPIDHELFSSIDDAFQLMEYMALRSPAI